MLNWNGRLPKPSFVGILTPISVYMVLHKSYLWFRYDMIETGRRTLGSQLWVVNIGDY